ncbi:RsmB/NOP family class I SAM-dependent RNA methyltransferase, partial [Candidatus Bathyarchaeota archaeon]|nr:RsmB/NOP family class I SAM-dependent RNA methyltransferase [Candidatus Bathyarchaeota archaeon]
MDQGDTGGRLLQDAVALAVEALSWIELEGLGERQAFSRASKQLEIHEEACLRLAFSLVTETVRRLNLIDSIADWAASPIDLDELSLGAKNFLRLYVYWTHFRKSSLKDALRLLNCGRRVLGLGELHPIESAFGKVLGFDLDLWLNEKPERSRVSLRTFQQGWFADYCLRLFGRDEGLKLLDRSNERPPIYLRINRLKRDPDQAVSALQLEGVRLARVDGLEDLWVVEEASRPLVKLQSYRDGLFQIQDLSSQAACVAADPEPGDVVLDICAAPGVKTCSLAQMMDDRGELICVDISEARMQTWRKETNRLGIRSAQPLICDARSLPLNLETDLVLLDPPCSNTGVFAKSPSLKWRISPRDV